MTPKILGWSHGHHRLQTGTGQGGTGEGQGGTGQGPGEQVLSLYKFISVCEVKSLLCKFLILGPAFVLSESAISLYCKSADFTHANSHTAQIFTLFRSTLQQALSQLVLFNFAWSSNGTEKHFLIYIK